MKSIENLSPEFITAIKNEVENCPTLQRMNKSEILTVELDDRRNVEFVNKISCRIIQSTYVPRNFLCDITLRMSVSNLISL